MTHEQFCKKHGVKVKSFRWWLYRLRESAAQKRVELLPVALVAGGERGTTAEVIESSPSAPREVVVKVGAFSVGVAVGTDIGYVAALLKELESRC